MTPENERKKEWLCRYLEARRDQLALEHELEQYRLSALPSGISYDGVGGGGSVPHGYEVYASKLDDYFLELSKQIEKCQAIRREVLQAIEGLHDETERSVMKARYIFLREKYTRGNLTGYGLRYWDDIEDVLFLSTGYASQVHGRALQHLNI